MYSGMGLLYGSEVIVPLVDHTRAGRHVPDRTQSICLFFEVGSYLQGQPHAVVFLHLRTRASYPKFIITPHHCLIKLLAKLERRHSCQEHLLFLQNICVGSPEPSSDGTQLLVTPVPKDPATSSGLSRHLHTHMTISTHRHRH